MLGLPDSLPIPTVWLLVAILLFIILGLIIFTFIAFATKIPYIKEQFIAQIKKRPGMFLHSVTKQLHFYAPKRAGDHEERNHLDLPHSIGALFQPDHEHIEHFDRLPISNYFTKSSISLPPEKVKAIEDFYDFMGSRGIQVNEELIDVMFVHNCDIQDVYEDALLQEVAAHLPVPLDGSYDNLTDEEAEEYNQLQTDVEELESDIQELQADKANKKHRMSEILGLIDEETGKKIQTLREIKEELEETVVKDGLFVFQQVQDFALAVADKNSSNISEAISIANAEAMANAEKPSKSDDMIKIVVMAIVLLAGLAIVYKIVSGT
jgi:hypothetical protein